MDIQQVIEILKEDPSYLARRAEAVAPALLEGIERKKAQREENGKQVSPEVHDNACRMAIERIKRNSTLGNMPTEYLRKKASEEYSHSVSSLSTAQAQREGVALRHRDRSREPRSSRGGQNGGVSGRG